MNTINQKIYYRLQDTGIFSDGNIIDLSNYRYIDDDMAFIFCEINRNEHIILDGLFTISNKIARSIIECPCQVSLNSLVRFPRVISTDDISHSYCRPQGDISLIRLLEIDEELAELLAGRNSGVTTFRCLKNISLNAAMSLRKCKNLDITVPGVLSEEVIIALLSDEIIEVTF